MSYPSWQWRLTNILARLFGLLFCLAGLFGLFSLVAAFRAHRISPLASWHWLTLLLCMVATGVAFLVVRVRPPSPHLQSDGHDAAKTDQMREHPTMAS